MGANYRDEDEFPIAVIPDTPMFNETYAAMFADPRSKLAIFSHIGRWHGDRTMWREVIQISLPDQRTLFNRSYGRNGDARGPGGGHGYFHVIEPGRRMRLTFEGPVYESSLEDLLTHGARPDVTALCRIDVTFESAAPIWNMKGDSAGASHIAGAVHIDHIGKANGTVEYGGETFRLIDGYSIRDHSRGPRDMSYYGAHSWINGIFPDGRAFYLYTMDLQGSDQRMMNAVVTQGDALYPAKVISVQALGPGIDYREPHRIVLESELGIMEIAVEEVFNTFSVSLLNPFDTTPGWLHHRRAAHELDQSVRMVWNGQEGSGWCERGYTRKPL